MRTGCRIGAGWLAAGVAIWGAAAAWTQELRSAPRNPAFEQYLEQLSAPGLTGAPGAERPRGLIPPPFKIPPAPAGVSARPAARALPSSYDLRAAGKVSSVKDQGNYGNCWTFATYGSLESCLLTGESWDFSENNLANKHGFNSAYGDGGNHFMALAYLARWSGPVLEADDPYANGPNSPSGLAVRKHIQNAYLPADRASPGDNNTLKQALVDRGALYSSICWNSSYYQDGNAAYYYSGSAIADHAITIVGWDDNYSRTQFKTPPPGDGAFLVKNSWGTAWGDNGYFWVSYHDQWIGTDNAQFYSAAATSNYESVYQYDPLGFCNAYGYSGSTTAWGANIFTNASGIVRAVSFYAVSAGASYEIRIYTGGNAGDPVSGTLALTQSGSATQAGYYTVALNSAVSFSTRFAVVVKLTTPGGTTPIAVEEYLSGYSTAATANPGESYISANGVSWSEAKNPYNDRYMNVCLKAFGTGGSSPGPTPPTPTTSYTPQLDDFDGDYRGDPTLYDATAGRWMIRLSRNNWAQANFSSGASSAFRPLSGFFDNDWSADPTIYSTASGRWYFALSTDSYNWWYLGWYVDATSLPVCADFDGDGYADPTFYCQTDGYWYILLSSTGGEYYYPLGYSASAGLLPFGGDFDGDGYADPTFYSPNTHNWYILVSSWGYRDYHTLNFGASGYTPALGDFDGDFRADPAARNAEGKWYVLLSTSGYAGYFDFTW